MKRYIFITILFYLVFLTFVSYRVSKAYFTDMAVASSNTFTAAAEFPLTPTPTPTENVVLNEILFDPSTGTEWVEIYNAGGTNVDLANWELFDEAGNIEGLTSLGTLNAGSYATLDISPQILNDTGDTVNLRNASDITVDSHAYDGNDSDEDQTIGRDTDGTGNWKTCTTPTKNTTNNSNC